MPGSNSKPDSQSLTVLRAKVTQLETNFKRAVTGGAMAISVLGYLGFDKLNEIESKAKERIDQAISDSTMFLDLVINGQTRVQVFQWAAAIPYFEKALSLRSDDEVVLWSLLNCYVNSADLDAGLRLLEDIEKGGGLFSKRFSEFWTLQNISRLLILASIDKPELSNKAEYYVGRAIRSAELLKGGELSYALYAKAIFEYTRPNQLDWRASLVKAVNIDPRVRDWPTEDRPDPWIQLVLRKYPKFIEEFNLTAKGITDG